MKKFKIVSLLILLTLFTACFNGKEKNMAKSALKLEGVRNTTLEFYIYKTADKDRRISKGENIEQMLANAISGKDYSKQLKEYLDTGDLDYKISYKIIGKKDDGTLMVKYTCLDTEFLVPIIPDGDFIYFYPSDIEVTTSKNKTFKPLANNGPFSSLNVYAY